jgi:hypothetical protein
MLAINVRIVRWVSDDQPGIVECELTDRFGITWRFIEKSPIVSSAPIGGDRGYPQHGVIACEVTASGQDEAGRQIADIDTENPWGVQSVDGTSRFFVFADQLVELTHLNFSK